MTPKHGVDKDGTFQRASWASCAQALAIFLDGLEASQPEMCAVIEAEVSGLGKDDDVNTDDDDSDITH